MFRFAQLDSQYLRDIKWSFYWFCWDLAISWNERVLEYHKLCSTCISKDVCIVLQFRSFFEWESIGISQYLQFINKNSVSLCDLAIFRNERSLEYLSFPAYVCVNVSPMTNGRWYWYLILLKYLHANISPRSCWYPLWSDVDKLMHPFWIIDVAWARQYSIKTQF